MNETFKIDNILFLLVILLGYEVVYFNIMKLVS